MFACRSTPQSHLRWSPPPSHPPQLLLFLHLICWSLPCLFSCSVTNTHLVYQPCACRQFQIQTLKVQSSHPLKFSLLYRSSLSPPTPGGSARPPTAPPSSCKNASLFSFSFYSFVWDLAPWWILLFVLSRTISDIPAAFLSILLLAPWQAMCWDGYRRRKFRSVFFPSFASISYTFMIGFRSRFLMIQELLTYAWTPCGQQISFLTIEKGYPYIRFHYHIEISFLQVTADAIFPCLCFLFLLKLLSAPHQLASDLGWPWVIFLSKIP